MSKAKLLLEKFHIMEGTYWGNKGKYQKDYDRLTKKLVPVDGKAATVEGELLRALGRIYYDYYNNGFGNNWSGALNYIKKYFPISSKHYDALSEFSTGKIYDYRGRYMENILESLANTIINYVISREGHFAKNTVDMYSLQDDDYNRHDDWEYADDDEMDDWEYA